MKLDSNELQQHGRMKMLVNKAIRESLALNVLDCYSKPLELSFDASTGLFVESNQGETFTRKEMPFLLSSLASLALLVVLPEP